LHKETYNSIREEFELASQLVIRCLAKVANAYKLDKLTQKKFRPLGSIAYDSQIMTFFTEAQEVSLWTVAVPSA
jgi:putative transposase